MIALFGGTFDPPHIGHLNGIVNGAKEIGIDRVRLLPCAQSPLKLQTGATEQQRVAMLNLACEHYNSQESDVTLSVDTTELALPKPSFTVNTLKVIRRDIATKSPLCFFLGEDSLYTLHKWKDWQSITNYCHIIVLRREGFIRDEPEHLSQWLDGHITDDIAQLHQQAGGLIYRCHTPLNIISSSELRSAVTQDVAVAKRWLPHCVFEYIINQHIYT